MTDTGIYTQLLVAENKLSLKEVVLLKNVIKKNAKKACFIFAEEQ